MLLVLITASHAVCCPVFHLMRYHFSLQFAFTTSEHQLFSNDIYPFMYAHCPFLILNIAINIINLFCHGIFWDFSLPFGFLRSWSRWVYDTKFFRVAELWRRCWFHNDDFLFSGSATLKFQFRKQCREWSWGNIVLWFQIGLQKSLWAIFSVIFWLLLVLPLQNFVASRRALAHRIIETLRMGGGGLTL